MKFKFSFWDILPYRWSMYYYEIIKPIFCPQNSRLRKFIPRKWCDTTELMVDINFEMIKIFYENEYLNGYVDWQSDEIHKKFADWLEKTYQYITKVRPELEEKLSNSYPPSRPFDEWFKEVEVGGKKMFEMIQDDVPYEVKYKDVIYFEKMIKDLDTKTLKEFAENREYFWT